VPCQLDESASRIIDSQDLLGELRRQTGIPTTDDQLCSALAILGKPPIVEQYGNLPRSCSPGLCESFDHALIELLRCRDAKKARQG